jgi:hypothetical protein
MKKKILFSGFIASILIASCAREKEGVTNDIDTAAVIIVDTTASIDSSATIDTSAQSSTPSNDPKVNVNNYKHPNLSQKAREQQNAADGQPVKVVYKKDATGGNYKDNSNSTEVLTEDANTTQNKVEAGNTSNGGNYKKQHK